MLKKLLGESAIYGISSIVTKFIGIFLVPIYTQVFSPSDYGIVALTIASFSLLGMLAIFGLDSASALYFYDFKENEDRKKPIANWFWTQLTFSSGIAFIIILFSKPASTLLFDSPIYFTVLILAAVQLIFSTFTTVLQKWLRFQRKALTTVTVTLFTSLLNIGLNILFVVYLGYGIEGIFLALLISSIFSFFLCLYMMQGWLSISHFDWTLHKKMLHFGLPLVPAAIAYWISNSSASYFINFSLTKTEVGLFQIGSSLATGVMLVTGAFQMAIGPFIFSQKEGPEIKTLINRVFIGYLAITTIIVSGISIFSYEILVLLTREAYYPSKTVVPVLSFNFLLIGLNYIGALGLNLAKDNKPYMYAVVAGSVLNVILFFILIPLLGKDGAAWSMTISNIIATILIFIFSLKRYPVKFNFKCGFIVLALGAMVSFGANPWEPAEFWLGVFFKILIFASAIGAISIVVLPKLKEKRPASQAI